MLKRLFDIIFSLLGLIVFILSGDVAKFVALLGISVALFVVLATKTPGYISQIEQEAVQQWQQQDHEDHTCRSGNAGGC